MEGIGGYEYGGDMYTADLFRTYDTSGSTVPDLPNLAETRLAEERAAQTGFWGWLYGGTVGKAVSAVKGGLRSVLMILFFGALIALVLLVAGTRFVRAAEG